MNTLRLSMSSPAGLIAAACSELMTCGFAGAAPEDVLDANTAARLRGLMTERLNVFDCRVASLHVRQEAEDAIAVDVALGDQSVTLALEPHSVRAPGYKLLVQVEGGAIVEAAPGPERNYWGRLADMPGTLVAASILDDGIYAAIGLADGRQWWIQPAKPHVLRGDFDQPIADDVHVIYRGEDIKRCDAKCGVNDAFGAAFPMAGGAGPDGGGVDDSGTSICIAEVAADADREYFLRYGTVNKTEARIMSVINGVNVQYAREVGITHYLSTILVRTAEPDPYFTNDSGNLLDQCRAEWQGNQGGVPRDIVHLFTGKNIDDGVIGLAFLNAVRNFGNGYGLVQSDFEPGFGCVTDLSAHELGHNWGAGHCNCDSPPYTMNPFLVCANVHHSTQTIPVIVAYRNSVGCLQCGSLFHSNLGIPGELTGDKFGRAVAFIRDVNGDSQPDVIVGAPDNDEAGVNAGKVYVYSGADGTLIWSKKGQNAGDRFGYAVAAHDNKVLVGAPFNDAGGTDAGRLYIYNGNTQVLIKIKNGANAGDRYGSAVAGGVDVNKDGIVDLLVGAPGADTPGSNSGDVFVLSGAGYGQLKKLSGEASGDAFGTSVAFVGRVDGDTNNDFIVGAPLNDATGVNAGKANVYSGKTYSLLRTVVGIQANGQLGTAVAGGNFDGDTFADFVVSAPRYDNGASLDVGRVSAHAGATSFQIWFKIGNAAGDRLGSSLAIAGDPNGDGRNEVVAGAPFSNVPLADAGAAYVYSGPTGALLYTFTGEQVGDQFGTAVAGRGSFNSPNAARVAVGALFRDAGVLDEGRVYTYSSLQSGTSDAPGVPPSAPPCAADIAGSDRVVNIDDLLEVITAWGPCAGCAPDVNNSGFVDIDDLLAVINGWGPCD